MANIVINENCNQNCPYCFASEFVNVKHNNISYDNFVKTTDFLLTETDENRKGKIGIIGGEPLLHPDFDRFIKYLINRDDISRITVFTNGVLINNHLDTLLHEKVGLLINVNSIYDVGENNYKKTIQSIETLVNLKNKKQLTLGLNIYDNIDYNFFIELAERYRMKRVRLSVVVPAFGKEKNGISHFLNLKQSVLAITKALLSRDILFRFDCNLPVPCIWSETELSDMKLMGLCTYSRELIPLEQSFCSPVIDILPDLTTIRCFGLSDLSKTPISQYNSIQELRQYYIENFDAIQSKKALYEGCNTCSLFPQKCFGGCLANREIK